MKLVNPVTNTEITNAKEASDAIQALISEGERLIDVEATRIADAFGVEFSVGDYGSGRTYNPKGTPEDDLSYVYSYYDGFDEEGKSLSGHWVSSSETC